MATRNASAQWQGTLMEGDGTMALGSGAWEGRFTFKSRFEEGEGTNPEELIGAAEAGCFTMQLAHDLSEAGHTVESVQTQAKVQIRNVDGKPTVAKIDLITRGRVPGLDEARFKEAAEATKDACIISRALRGVDEITVDAALEG
jgi:osmotically inducible protein OsmC